MKLAKKDQVEAFLKQAEIHGDTQERHRRVKKSIMPAERKNDGVVWGDPMATHVIDTSPNPAPTRVFPFIERC
jgi:hypothetical protein